MRARGDASDAPRDRRASRRRKPGAYLGQVCVSRRPSLCVAWEVVPDAFPVMTKEVGESSGAAAPVSTQYRQYIRDNYTVWATMMMWALESNEVWEAVDPDGDEFMKGAPKYRKDR
ncbi:hypothetical protein QYE76_047364 [Lolium multiflorum]|uniref:Uncharacterized protein n=1 Tax=Lolium multiflorum TaxID=4521 RepID=A0AAD8TRR6_LOLMU|nr:hypothetical protein QYE76_047364 [Lolium multiflorum]